MNEGAQSLPEGWFLKTFGHPAVLTDSGAPLGSLRTKDLALLVYLTVDPDSVHSRVALSDLLWGDSPEENARHSLTQTLHRLRARIGERFLRLDGDTVEIRHRLPSDVALLHEAAEGTAEIGAGLEFYVGDFLEDFQVGSGAERFHAWADRWRAHLRFEAIEILDGRGTEAERREAWHAALRLGRRLVSVEPIFEEGHRRIMRAWYALGARNLAAEHYDRLRGWLRTEIGAEPDPRTRALARELEIEADLPRARSPSRIPSDSTWPADMASF